MLGHNIAAWVISTADKLFAIPAVVCDSAKILRNLALLRTVSLVLGSVHYVESLIHSLVRSGGTIGLCNCAGLAAASVRLCEGHRR
jgi:hypothetical protein